MVLNLIIAVPTVLSVEFDYHGSNIVELYSLKYHPLFTVGGGFRFIVPEMINSRSYLGVRQSRIFLYQFCACALLRLPFLNLVSQSK